MKTPEQIAFRKARREAREAGQPLPQVNEFRSQQATTDNKPAQPHVKLPGDELERIIRERYHIAPCQSCMDTMQKMNDNGVSWCREHVTELAAEIHANARARKWTAVLAAFAESTGLVDYEALVIEACDACEPCEPIQIEDTPCSLPVKMVAPGDKRRGIYRGGILQIMVTRACDLRCNNCTQGSNLKGNVNHMTPEQFRVAVTSLKDYFGVVGIFGGNPCLHPQFPELCEILRDVIPWERRGLWSNHPRGVGRHAAITFNPAFSNLNVHQSQAAYDEFARDWPESVPFLKGLETDSRHAPVWTAMRDLIPDEQERWKLIGDCDINKHWSALIGTFRGMLRGWFCEIAGSQSMLMQDDLNYPDTGVPITEGWWRQGMSAFEHQVRKHCHECGIPLNGHGSLANSSEATQVSKTWEPYIRPRGGEVDVVTSLVQLGSRLPKATDYIENGAIE